MRQGIIFPIRIVKIIGLRHNRLKVSRIPVHLPYNIMDWNGKVELLKGWKLQKILIISKNDSNTKFNFLQKLSKSVSLSTTGVELGGIKDMSCLKYYNTLRQFTLGLNAAKNIDYIEKWFKRKLCKIKFLTKYSVEAYLYLPPEWS